MAVRHGKMTQSRNEEILLDIKMVANGNLIEIQGEDIGIKRKTKYVKMSSDEDNKVYVDLGVHFVKCHEDSGRMDVNIATAKAKIIGASKENLDKAGKLVSQIISTSLSGLKPPGGQAEVNKL